MNYVGCSNVDDSIAASTTMILADLTVMVPFGSFSFRAVEIWAGIPWRAYLTELGCFLVPGSGTLQVVKNAPQGFDWAANVTGMPSFSSPTNHTSSCNRPLSFLVHHRPRFLFSGAHTSIICKATASLVMLVCSTLACQSTWMDPSRCLS
jgi:hypothetical protein